jgi:hypothetical protein
VLDSVQRVVCLAGAIWYLIAVREWVGFVVILAAGHMDATKAKQVLVKALKGIVGEKYVEYLL